MKRSIQSATSAAFVLGFGLLCSPTVRAQTPDYFVPESECGSRDCTCDDLPMMEAFLKNQQTAQHVWTLVRDYIPEPDGPRSMEEAKELFEYNFPGDPRISAQFKTCDGYDPKVNTLKQIAAVPGIGQASLDPCFCNAFCKSIIDATIDHEHKHAPTLLLGFANVIEFKFACAAHILPDSFCGSLDPMILSNSEIESYGAGNDTLDEAIDDLSNSNPEDPSMECTWESLPPPPPPTNVTPPPPAPSGFFQRIQLLVRRFVHGASQ